MEHPTNAALEAAIVANADEDTPRLAYADWLDEHGDPGRAEFIRLQCRLADLSPAEPDWVSLRERQLELAARLKSRYLQLNPKAPDKFYLGYDFTDEHEEPFRRGFRYFIDCQMRGEAWPPKEIDRINSALAHLVRTSTVRGFSIADVPLPALTQVLATPAAAELTGLALMYEVRDGDGPMAVADYFQFVANCPALQRVQQLFLYSPTHPIRATELSQATTFGAVHRLTIQRLTGTTAALNKLTKANWFRQLRHFHCHLDAPGVAKSVLTGLGKLPDLHTLELPDLAAAAVGTLAAGKFPALGRLIFGGPLGPKIAGQLAKAEFPALTAFEAVRSTSKNDGLAELLKAPWFAKLRLLDLADNGIGDQGVKALAASPVAKQLRVLKLGANTFGPTGLRAITGGAFPELTTLDLHSFTKRKGTPADFAKALTGLQLPRLRHLDLSGWPLGDEGATALAANRAFANLTRLSLKSCMIGNDGARALFASPHLQNLVELELNDNEISTGADALADPAVMPHLGECGLSGNKLGRNARDKFARDGLALST